MTHKHLELLVSEFYRNVAEPGMIKWMLGELVALIDLERCDQDRLANFVDEMEETLED